MPIHFSGRLKSLGISRQASYVNSDVRRCFREKGLVRVASDAYAVSKESGGKIVDQRLTLV